MSSQGPLGPGGATSLTGIGTVAWTSPGNVTVLDGNCASAFLGGGLTSNWLFAANFGFTIPANSTINGITVTWWKMGTTAFITVDAGVRIVKGGVIGSHDESSVTSWPYPSVSPTTYGGASDLWGQTWTATDINSNSFGAAIAAISGGAAEVDYVTITVTYTVGVGGPAMAATRASASHAGSRSRRASRPCRSLRSFARCRP